MSHIGKKIINIPSGLKVQYKNNLLSVTGPLGAKELQLPSFLKLDWMGAPIRQLSVKIDGSSSKRNKEKALWGTYRTLISQLFQGVKTGFSKKLLLVGVGYRAQIEDQILHLKLGYSHLVRYPIPMDVQIQCIQPTIILITGIDKRKVNQVAAEIRSYRKPEPYKGKGIRYENETILLKEGKKT